MPGTPRQMHYQVVHFLRKRITFADRGKVLTIGTVPAGSLILRALSGVHVVTAFNDGTNKQIDIGVSSPALTDDDLFGTDMSVAAVGNVPLDENVSGMYLAQDTDITVTPDLTGTAATTGEAIAYIAYLPNIDG